MSFWSEEVIRQVSDMLANSCTDLKTFHIQLGQDVDEIFPNGDDGEPIAESVDMLFVRVFFRVFVNFRRSGLLRLVHKVDVIFEGARSTAIIPLTSVARHFKELPYTGAFDDE